MSNSNATDSRLTSLRNKGKEGVQVVDADTGIPVEGQVPKNCVLVTANGALSNYYEFQQLAPGVALTLDASDIKNFVGRSISLISPVGGAGTTLTLTGAIGFDQTANKVATFDAVNRSSLILVFLANSDYTTFYISTAANDGVTFSP